MASQSFRPKVLNWHRYIILAIGIVLAIETGALAENIDETVTLETLATTVGMSSQETMTMMQDTAVQAESQPTEATEDLRAEDLRVEEVRAEEQSADSSATNSSATLSIYSDRD